MPINEWWLQTYTHMKRDYLKECFCNRFWSIIPEHSLQLDTSFISIINSTKEFNSIYSKFIRYKFKRSMCGVSQMFGSIMTLKRANLSILIMIIIMMICNPDSTLAINGEQETNSDSINQQQRPIDVIKIWNQHNSQILNVLQMILSQSHWNDHHGQCHSSLKQLIGDARKRKHYAMKSKFEHEFCEKKYGKGVVLLLLVKKKVFSLWLIPAIWWLFMILLPSMWMMGP